MLFHLNRLFIEKNQHKYDVNAYADTWIGHYLSFGDFGVELFFVISGFILGLPFAKAYLVNGKPIDIKSFFLKRLTRLEPPYILVMVLLFFATVYFGNSLTFQDGLKSLFSSIFYIHNFVYGKDTYPLINAVAWSLEIEVQFYLLAPLLGLVFKIPKRLTRYLIIISASVFFTFLTKLIDFPFISLMDFLGFFGIGFILADLYIVPSNFKIENSWLISLLTLALLIPVFTLVYHEQPLLEQVFWQLVQFVMIFIIYYNVLFTGTFSLLRNKFVTNIGGMCYTIYLTHGTILSIFGHSIIQYKFTSIRLLDNLIYTIFLLAITLILSAIFYLLVERPCMNKNWPQELLAKVRGKAIVANMKS